MDYIDATLKLVIITILAGVVGLDREMRGKPAGAKTHILVGIGSTIFTIVSVYFYTEYNSAKAVVDPSRIAAQIVTGIGFLGAGTIIQSGGSVIGLTTAASLWSVAAIGIAVGIGLYPLAAIATAIVIFVFLTTNKVSAMFEEKVGSSVEKIKNLRKKKK